MAGRFHGKVAVVMGAASGIGLAIARRLHNEGATVVAADVNQDGLGALEAELGKRCFATVADVTHEAHVEAAMAAAVDRFGSVDTAFNVAGASRPGYIVDLPEADWDFTVDLCLKGVFLGMKHQARQMMRQKNGGTIVNIASLNAHVPMHAGSAYVSAKAGVEALTKNGALEFAEHGIRVNAILPGLVQTPLMRRHFDHPEALAAFVERIPMGRPAQPGGAAA
jgi:NAD(P)-dependent dehydrogenase (short-subunit alcohol dehydrogenase family)